MSPITVSVSVRLSDLHRPNGGVQYSNDDLFIIFTLFFLFASSVQIEDDSCVERFFLCVLIVVVVVHFFFVRLIEKI